MGSSEKICALCGEDCRDRPRTKDRRGRYYCTVCHEQAQRDAAVPPDPAGAFSPAAVEPPAARWHLWPVYLYFRPGLFFRLFTAETGAIVIGIFAWVVGIAGIIDRVQTRALAAEMAGRPSVLPNDWAVHWGVYVGLGVIGGIVAYGIGGWWYRMRLRFCGAVDPDPALARRVFILASLVVAFPTLFVKLVETARFATPSEAMHSAFSVFDWLVIVTAFWSVWASFVGVRTVFETGLVRAIIWFLVLPVAVYGLVFIAAVLGAVLFASPPADVAHPQSIVSNTFRFDYPGNWWIDDTDPEHDLDWSIAIEPWQDAVIRLMLYESDEPLEDELAVSVEAVRDEAQSFRDGAPFTRYGAYEGVGQSFVSVYESIPFSVRMFVTDLGDGRYLEIQAFCAEEDLDEVRPGFRQIEHSLSVR